ncbi:hypothetical protein AVEN_195722-1 [Araneus ventricosus]|uniref:Uncharacterized protein n=1 Tax=Araneus ventricosus TaxID=182803 RepID=A0A4Y2S6P3_ARAVE|nr:hypothetical protein AVEN_195722-1 [Araneus ventricosus]
MTPQWLFWIVVKLGDTGCLCRSRIDHHSSISKSRIILGTRFETVLLKHYQMSFVGPFAITMTPHQPRIERLMESPCLVTMDTDSPAGGSKGFKISDVMVRGSRRATQ